VALENPEQKVSEVIKDYVISKYPAWSKDEVRLTFKFAEKTFDELRTLDEGTTIKVLEVYPEFRPVGSVIFPLLVESADGSQKILLRTKVEVMQKIAAAANLIKKGKMLEASDIKLEERDVALLPQKYFMESLTLAGKEAKISIPKNSTVFEWMVGNPPLFHSGTEVFIRVSAPGLVVKAKGLALADGHRGEEIKVKRLDSNKTVMAKVVSPNEVEVELK
jgi:flagella basal body P-ring formation protein FlgA